MLTQDMLTISVADYSVISVDQVPQVVLEVAWRPTDAYRVV